LAVIILWPTGQASKAQTVQKSVLFSLSYCAFKVVRAMCV